MTRKKRERENTLLISLLYFIIIENSFFLYVVVVERGDRREVNYDLAVLVRSKCWRYFFGVIRPIIRGKPDQIGAPP